jgi:hypothetical protein
MGIAKRRLQQFAATFVTALTCVAGLPAYAADLSYSFVEVDYIPAGELDDSPKIDVDGFGINASYELSDKFFLSASYQDISGDRGEDDNYDATDLDAELLRVGFGLHGAISDSVDWVVGVDFARLDTEYDSDGDSTSDNGYIIDLGIRGLLNDSFEYSAALVQSDIIESETGFRVGGRYHFNDSGFSIGADYVQYASDLDLVELGFRYQFD